MVHPERLILIGYWAGAETDDSWPDPKDFMDPSWDSEEREVMASYLSAGLVARTYMGFSRCRVCGVNNGNLELSDGYYVWPDGLAHYVADHAVRLPERFVAHVSAMIEALEGAERDVGWWREVEIKSEG